VGDDADVAQFVEHDRLMANRLKDAIRPSQ
jgi:hypothetical protein